MSAFVAPTPLLLTSAARLTSSCPASGSLRASAFAARPARLARPAPPTMEMQMEQENIGEPMQEPMEEPPALEETKLFVGNLSWGTNDSSLGDAFSRFGNVIDARVVTDRFTQKSRGFGFIEYELASSAEDALVGMNGVEVDGRPVRVDRANRRPPRQRRPNNNYNNPNRDYNSGGGGYNDNSYY